MSISVLIIEDEPIIAGDLEMTLIGHDYHVAGIAYNSTRALDMIHSYRPDVVLLDIAIKGDKDGIDIATIIQEKYKIPFIYVTSFSDKDTLDRAKMTFPYGYIVKPFKDRDIISAIEMAVYRHAVQYNQGFPLYETVLANYALTQAEYDILKSVWDGKTNSQIAEDHGVTLNTVKTHLKHIFSKMETRSRSEAIAAIRQLL